MRILKPNLSATPEAINNKNQTVGTVRFSNAYSSGSNAVVLRPHHQPIRLGDLRDIPGRPDSGGSDINEIGTVLLTAVGDGNIGQVALWTAREGLRSIGLPGRPYAINNRNEVVASSGSAAGDIGFFWRDDVGLVRLLDALVSGSPMFDTIAGFDINDSGMISGTATRNAGAIRVAVVLTPVTPAK